MIDLTWRVYPGGTLVALGAAIAIWGFGMELKGLRRAIGGRHSEILRFLQGFRLSVIGLAVAAMGIAWTWHLTWLLVFALVIGGEETLESSVHIFAVRRGNREMAKRLARHQDAGISAPGSPHKQQQTISLSS